jgi:two-component system, NtrC family, sensor histidine kinase HydH
LRHLSISLAAIAAYAMRRELHVGTSVLWVLGVAAVVNVAIARLSDIPSRAAVARRASPILGIGGWAALSFLTGGVDSPLVAGFWLEIIFSAMVLSPVGTLLLTGAVAATLWVLQAVLGLREAWGHLSLQTGFVAAIGLLTFYASRRWSHEHQVLSGESIALSRRLRDLESELDSARTLGQVGARVARLAHSLKNTVHSLRGFTQLIESPLAGSHAQRQALGGLHLAIDRLEETARATLRPPDARDVAPQGATTSSELGRTLDEVLSEMALLHTGVRWVKAPSDRLPSIALPSGLLREVLLILTQNAAEASGASGEVVLTVHADQDRLRLVVQDQGPGIDPEIRGALFRPGTTNKPSGSGFGLFLARRLVEAGGGQLTIDQAAQGGALVSVQLPVLRN